MTVNTRQIPANEPLYRRAAGFNLCRLAQNRRLQRCVFSPRLHAGSSSSSFLPVNLPPARQLNLIVLILIKSNSGSGPRCIQQQRQQQQCMMGHLDDLAFQLLFLITNDIYGS